MTIILDEEEENSKQRHRRTRDVNEKKTIWIVSYIIKLYERRRNVVL